MLAELALDACERVAEAEFDFAYTDCLADFEAKTWYVRVSYAGPGGHYENYLPDDLFCIEPD